jgi:hypothetical protein
VASRLGEDRTKSMRFPPFAVGTIRGQLLDRHQFAGFDSIFGFSAFISLSSSGEI